jgi:hypothetical protein
MSGRIAEESVKLVSPYVLVHHLVILLPIMLVLLAVVCPCLLMF